MKGTKDKKTDSFQGLKTEPVSSGGMTNQPLYIFSDLGLGNIFDMTEQETNRRGPALIFKWWDGVVEGKEDR